VKFDLCLEIALSKFLCKKVEQLTADLASQWDVTSRLQLEVDKQRRVEAELRRELTQKNNLIEDMRKELNAKIGKRTAERDLKVAFSAACAPPFVQPFVTTEKK